MTQRPTSPFAAGAIAFCLALCPAALWAQAATEKNPPRRLPPTGSQATDIPAGVDTGSPTTSNKMPLGMPVPPALLPDTADQNKRSAAARAAARPVARPGPGAAADCTPASTRAGAPVALPQTGFVGSSASPAAASAVARGSMPRPC